MNNIKNWFKNFLGPKPNEIWRRKELTLIPISVRVLDINEHNVVACKILNSDVRFHVSKKQFKKLYEYEFTDKS